MNPTTASTTARSTRPGRSYAVADDLEQLKGPTDGEIQLPNRLDWGPPRRYCLRVDKDVHLYYERVLREATSLADLKTYLNGSVLRHLWRSLVLPPRLRDSWESRFPTLQRSTVTDAERQR